ncbi:MAG: TRAP transporter substrate-binding protein DctP [Chloroflexota bacterium]
MKRWYFIWLILLVSALVLISCAQPAPSPAQVFKLKLHGGFPKGDPWHENLNRAWMDPLPALSNGRLQFEEYTGGQLVAAPELHDALSKGMIDITNTAWIWYTGTVPEASITWLPLMYESSQQQVDVFWKVQRPIMDKLYREKYKQVVLSMGYSSPLNIWTNKPVRKMEDLKGLKLRATGGVTSKYLQELGAGVVSMTAPEAVPALQSGALDGVTYEASTFKTYDLYKIAPYVIYPAHIWCHVGIFWNLDSWNKLPADLQDIIMKHSEKVNYQQGQDSIALTKKAFEEAKARGVTVTELPKEELARWEVKARAVWDWFAAQSPTSKQLLTETMKYIGKK